MSKEYIQRLIALLEQVDWETIDFIEQYLTKKAEILKQQSALQEVL